MKAERGASLRINAPEWFAREDFRTWLDGSSCATWHTRGTVPGEYSDAFVTFDHGEGSDRDELPRDIWRAITTAAAAVGMAYGLVWISNVE